MDGEEIKHIHICVFQVPYLIIVRSYASYSFNTAQWLKVPQKVSIVIRDQNKTKSCTASLNTIQKERSLCSNFF